MELTLKPNEGQGFKRAYKVAKKLADRNGCNVTLLFRALGADSHTVRPHVGKFDSKGLPRKRRHGKAKS